MKKNYLTIAFALAALLMTFAPSMSISAHAVCVNANPVADDDGPEKSDFYKQIPLWDGNVDEKTHLPAGWTVSFPEASADQYDDLVKSIECRHFDEAPHLKGNALKIHVKTKTLLDFKVKLADLGITSEMLAPETTLSYAFDFYSPDNLFKEYVEEDSVVMAEILNFTADGKLSRLTRNTKRLGVQGDKVFVSSSVPEWLNSESWTLRIILKPQTGTPTDYTLWIGNLVAAIDTKEMSVNVNVSNEEELYDNVFGKGYHLIKSDSTVDVNLYIKQHEPKKQHLAWKDSLGNIIGTDSILNITAKVPEPIIDDDGEEKISELNYTVWPYDKLRKAKVAAEGDGQVSMTSNGGFKGATEAELCPGESITCRASSTPTSIFAYWKDEKGNVVSKDTVYTFRLTEGDDEAVRTAVFQKLDKEVSYTIPEKWSTFYYRKDIMLPEDVLAYKISDLIEDGTKIAYATPINIRQSIKAYTPVLLENRYDHPVTITLLTCDNPADTIYTKDFDGLLQGTLIDTAAPDSSYVLLKKNDIFDFYLNDSSQKSPEAKAFTCWLKLSMGTVTFPSILKLESKTTGIVSVSTDDKADDKQTIYNLAGQKVATPQRGHLYIVNGRKVVW